MPQIILHVNVQLYQHNYMSANINDLQRLITSPILFVIAIIMYNYEPWNTTVYISINYNTSIPYFDPCIIYYYIVLKYLILQCIQHSDLILLIVLLIVVMLNNRIYVFMIII